ncbi:hypothetical protein VZ95_15625 [Elstera litoralis]|uniref:Uncharacterized protein n=1 Tax=Elstera litoralis TaxID=552518 RepID=A0A0F3IQ82_9PROT|nr:hypothetical protein [Elstera litoralis]KJV08772.1 hypothetical protein VZ95_15625 [Elstera litoralis]
MPNANPLRLLLAVAGVPSAETGRALQALSGALRGVGVAPILLSGWAGAGRLRVERSDAEGFPVYRSDAPLADIGLLAVMERPSLAVLVGAEALPLAGPLVAMGLPVILVVTGDQPLDLGALENTGLLALAATTPVEAARLARLQSGPVIALPLPAPEKARFEGDGAAILVLGGQRAEGGAVAVALAEARPAYRFIFPATVAQVPALLGRVSRLTNTQILAIDESVPPLRLGLLPNCVGVPPWETLAR